MRSRPAPHLSFPSLVPDLSLQGRVTGRLIKTNTSRPNPPSPSSRLRDSTGEPALAPEEVLFRRKNAPPRYAEKDIYFAGTDSLSADQRLPDSDLLKAVHGYASGFYEAVAVEQEKRGKTGRLGGRLADERSMDETALLAFGILLEEAAREALGKNGDLVFTEGVGKDGGTEDGKEKERAGGGSGPGSMSPARPAKRRRLSRNSSAL